jgi:HAD superfamily hydrolase (TIGR01509 family)
MKKLAILDFNRTIYDPETDDLVPGARDALKSLINKGFLLVLVSRQEGGRDELLSRFSLTALFQEAVFVPKKDSDLFAGLIEKYGVRPEDTLVVGDYLHEEIRGGNRAGARTVWLKRGPFRHLAQECPEDVPWRTIHEMSELMSALEQ